MREQPSQYVVIGNPIAHSKSPQIHQRFARQFNDLIDYQRMFIELGDFNDSVSAFFANGGAGANITLPFKTEAAVFADSCSETVKLAGAANTLIPTAQGIHAENTDGVGLVNDIQKNWGLKLDGLKVLIIGAGGATRGVLLPLLQSGVSAIHIANRTLSKAEQLVDDFDKKGLSAGGLDNYPNDFDLVINASAAGLAGESVALPNTVYHRHTYCYDMVYSNSQTAFENWATTAGLQARNGFGMLIEQAAQSYFLWHGHRPDTTKLLGAKDL